MELATPIQEIPKIRPLYQKKLHRAGIKTVLDLLFYFPSRYEDFSKILPISELKINENATISGEILNIESFKTKRKKMFLTEAVIGDKSGAIKAIWFGNPYLKKILKPKEKVYLSGKLIRSQGNLFLSNPIYEKISLYKKDFIHTGRIIPIYSESIGISSRWLRYIIYWLLENLKNKIPEILPQNLIKENNLLGREGAIFQIHFPKSIRLKERAQKRFAFEELFFLELFVLNQKRQLKKHSSLAIPIKLEVVKEFINSLPFSLTAAQKKVVWQILKDLEKERPMSRLLQGDVGSGKTVVATIAALNVAKAGFQVAFMAPTEILAKQHFETAANFLKDFNLNLALLTSKADKFISKKLKNQVIEISREKLLKKVRANEIDILIGTHALIQDKVKFKNLGLVIVDEQHRFGVEQRARLVANTANAQKKIPHLLSMTATPIPRTLALTIYGDLDLSLIDQMPRGKRKVKTILVPPKKRKDAYQFVKKEIKKGKQVFVICPRIEKDKKTKKVEKKKRGWSWSEVKAVKEEYEKLKKDVFKEFRIGMLHGKLASKEKERIMKDFRNKKIDILVSTSVVEVGIDVPEANLMIIEGAERFGLSQLHQFRGRIGRKGQEAFCLLFCGSSSKKSYQRLRALITTQDGLKLAEKDLEIRGPGDFLGKRQWGIPDLAMASLGDLSLVEAAREGAKKILEESPALTKYPFLLKETKKFNQKIHLE
jgi:ATP-dependent DNA helicase RecG